MFTPLRRFTTLGPLSLAFAFSFQSATADDLARSIPATLERAKAQYGLLMENVKDDPGIPRTFEHGKIVTVGPKDWTSGFIAGSLWYLYETSRDPKWLAAAQDYTVRLESVKDYAGSHDVGFMLGCSYGHGYRLTQNPEYRKVLLQGAATLSTRNNPAVGQIRSWDHGKWKFPVIIDNMMNLEFLMSAAREGGETRFKEISISHADKTLQNHFRPDASSFHVVDYDPSTGEVLVKKTHQGTADDSAWARGQAWALYGYTMMFRETKNPAYLDQAVKVANFILNHPRLQADKIPFWDFDAPNIPSAPRDASAAAVMSSALIELSGMTQGEASAAFLNLARQQLTSLSSPAYLAKLGENGGFILLHSVGNMPKNSEIDVPLNYADYYFLEALIRYQKLSTTPD
jgi:uncharacterized protein YyaL (SSP411 family)